MKEKSCTSVRLSGLKVLHRFHALGSLLPYPKKNIKV
jgi:hypothetical protein